MAGFAMVCAVAYCDTSKDSKESKEVKEANAAKTAAQAERRAMRMIKNALALIEEKEEDRAVNMLEAVSRMYPQSQARFKANLELGRHMLSKRDFDHALAELKKACEAKAEEVCAEANFLIGELHLAKNQPGEAAMVFRRVSQDFPTSDFANDAFFKIGQIHFQAGRWARATEAFEMV
jgi:TolA-binding protein